MQAKDFHLGDVLTITTGIVLSPRVMEGVYDILNFMSGESVFTHQIPRICGEAQPVLLRQHPFLADIVPPEEFDSPDHVGRWVAEQVAIHGEMLPVLPMTEGEHEYREAVSELAEKVHPDRIITVTQ